MLRFRGSTECSYIVDSYIQANSNKKETKVLLGFYASSGSGTYDSVTLYTDN